jgi:hypothetical protein
MHWEGTPAERWGIPMKKKKKERNEYLDRLMEERGVLRILCVHNNMVITGRVRVLS